MPVYESNAHRRSLSRDALEGEGQSSYATKGNLVAGQVAEKEVGRTM